MTSILVRLQQLAKLLYVVSQCGGFRSVRSTVAMNFSARQLQEKRRQQNMSLLITSIDLTKDFHLVIRNGLFKILKNAGCLPKLKGLIESFHNNMWGTVQHDGNVSKHVKTFNVVEKGCLLQPTLFGIFFLLLPK